MSYYLSPALVQLRAEINSLWPHRDKTSDGWIGDTSHAARPSDHNPAPKTDESPGMVRAIDIDEDLVVGLAEVGAAMPLVNQIIRDDRVAYVIYEGRIWQNPAVFKNSGWQPYSGVNAHRHHVHVSMRRGPRWDRNSRSWGIVSGVSSQFPGQVIPSVSKLAAPAPLAPLEESMKVIRNIDTGSIDLVGEVTYGHYEAVDTAGISGAVKTWGPLVQLDNAEWTRQVEGAKDRQSRMTPR